MRRRQGEVLDWELTGWPAWVMDLAEDDGRGHRRLYTEAERRATCEHLRDKHFASRKGR